MSDHGPDTGRSSTRRTWPPRAVRAIVAGVCVVGTATACVRPPDPPPPPPTTTLPGLTCRPGNFEQAIIERSADAEQPRWYLTVSGMESGGSTSLAAVTYVDQPDYWAIEVRLCWRPDVAYPGAYFPFVTTIDLTGITGTKGVEAVGGSRSQRLEVPPPPSAPKTLLEGTSWELNDNQIDSTPIPAGRIVTARFSATEMSGQAPCNTYRATYRTLGPRITLGPIGTTKIGCAPDVAQAETAFLAKLQSLTEFNLDAWHKYLVLSRGSGFPPLRFRSVTTAPG
jgi:heat shock protein HslJ